MSDNVLSLIGLCKSYGDRTILDDVTFGVDRGRHVGIIGANGAGKSTLLRILTGLEEPDRGQAVLRSGQVIHFLEQDPPLPVGATVREILMAPLQDAVEALSAYEAAVQSLDESADDLLHKVEQLDAWEWEHRLTRAAAELSIPDLDAGVDTMSGGERKRVALARMVLSGADLLLLDEPTNHLDTSAIDWLEAWLAATDATVLLVTHDRYFLDRVITQMVEVREGQLRVYAGGYTDYLAARAVEEEHRAVLRKRRLQLLRSELEWAKRSPKARTTKQKARLGRVDGLEEEQRALRVEENAASFSFGTTPRLGKTILELTSVCKGFDEGPALIDGLSFIMRRGERFGIVGPNGSGKSTFLKLVAGTLSPDRGTVNLGRNTKIAWLDQERSILDDNATVRSTVLPDGGEFVFPAGNRVHVTAWLSRFAFSVDSHPMKVSSLSGGERSRLAIARFLLEEANLLLLDEPTNDIDLMTLNVLEEALARFEGCVLVVSHDRFFLDKIVTGMLAFERDWAEGRGQVTVVQGDYTHYRRVRLKALEEARRAEEREAARGRKEAAAARKEAQRPPKAAGLSWKEARELETVEARIEALEDEAAGLARQLADGVLWSTHHDQARAIDRQKQALEAEQEALMGRWEGLMAKKEGAE